jgi:hypothetical protein
MWITAVWITAVWITAVWITAVWITAVIGYTFKRLYTKESQCT